MLPSLGFKNEDSTKHCYPQCCNNQQTVTQVFVSVTSSFLLLSSS